MGRELVGPFRVPEGVKMTSAKYVEFLTENFLPLCQMKNWAFRNKIIFRHDNAPFHAVRNTSASLAAMGIEEENLMVWPPSSPDLNPIEKLWSIHKQNVYESGRQFASKQELWETILTFGSSIRSSKNLEVQWMQELWSSYQITGRVLNCNLTC